MFSLLYKPPRNRSNFLASFYFHFWQCFWLFLAFFFGRVKSARSDKTCSVLATLLSIVAIMLIFFLQRPGKQEEARERERRRGRAAKQKNGKVEMKCFSHMNASANAFGSPGRGGGGRGLARGQSWAAIESFSLSLFVSLSPSLFVYV